MSSPKVEFPEAKVAWIETASALEEFCEHLQSKAYVAIDTEFHRERTYYAELALVQVASDERVACIDPLAGEGGTPLSLAPLQAILLNRDIVKVLHASRQDLEIFFLGCGEVPGPIFDTQVAAALLGLGDQIGYGALVERVCSRSLDKLHGRTDWMRRPLDAAVIEYAAHDVTYLRSVYLHLDQELRSKDRRSWLDEEQLTLTSTETYEVNFEDAWHKVKGSGRLKGKEAVVAQTLSHFREEEAQKKNRPRRRILSDEAIIDLARLRPDEANKLNRMRSLDDGTRKRYAKDIIAHVGSALARPKDEWPKAREKGRPATIDPALAEALSTVVEVCARAHNISSKTLCTRDELEAIAAGSKSQRLYTGWRKTLAGDAVKSFLDGEQVLMVSEGKLRLGLGPQTP